MNEKGHSRGKADLKETVEAIVLQNAGEYGRKPINDANDGYITKPVAGTVVDLTSEIPFDDSDSTDILRTGSAQIQFEVTSGSPTDSSKVIRVLENGKDPSSTEGFSFGDGDIYFVNGINNIQNFKAIALGGVTVTMHIQFFRTIEIDSNI